MKKTSLFLFLLFLVSYSCKQPTSLGPSPVPYVYVYTQIDVSTPLYSSIMNQQGAGEPLYLSGGNKGIIVFQDFFGNYVAFDRTCPYNVTSTCGVIRGSLTGLNLVCGSYSRKTLDACCATTYGLDGTVTHGPGTYPLKAYRVTVSGTVLTISN